MCMYRSVIGLLVGNDLVKNHLTPIFQRLFIGKIRPFFGSNFSIYYTFIFMCISLQGDLAIFKNGLSRLDMLAISNWQYICSIVLCSKFDRSRFVVYIYTVKIFVLVQSKIGFLKYIIIFKISKFSHDRLLCVVGISRLV